MSTDAKPLSVNRAAVAAGGGDDVGEDCPAFADGLLTHADKLPESGENLPINSRDPFMDHSGIIEPAPSAAPVPASGRSFSELVRHTFMRQLRSMHLKLTLVAALLLMGCRPEVSYFLGGNDNVRLIASPQSVKAWRTVGSLKTDEELTSSDYRAQWQKAGEGIIIPASLTTNLSKILSDKRSYDYHPGTVKASIAEPCVVFNFCSGNNSVDVFLSFADNSLIVMNATNSDPSNALAHPDIDPSRAELVKIVKEIFPHDTLIQSINDTKAEGSLWPRGTQRR